MTKKIKLEETQDENSKDKLETKTTICYLKSRANYTIPITYNNQTTFIPPFGMIKVIKEQTKFDKNDAKYLTFIK